MIFIALTFCLAGRRFIHLLTPVPLPKLPLILFLFLPLVWRFCSIHIYGWATLCRIFHSIVLVFISFICHFCLYSRYCCCLRLFCCIFMFVSFFSFGLFTVIEWPVILWQLFICPNTFRWILLAGYFEYTNTLAFLPSLSFSHRHRERERATNTQSKNVKQILQEIATRICCISFSICQTIETSFENNSINTKSYSMKPNRTPVINLLS